MVVVVHVDVARDGFLDDLDVFRVLCFLGYGKSNSGVDGGVSRVGEVERKWEKVRLRGFREGVVRL